MQNTDCVLSFLTVLMRMTQDSRNIVVDPCRERQRNEAKSEDWCYSERISAVGVMDSWKLNHR